MDSSDTDAYTPILTRPQRSYRRPHPPQQQQRQQQQRLGQSAQRYVSSYVSPTHTSTALPEYSPKITSPSTSDAPPTYTDVDAEDEGEDEGDDKALPLPMTSPRSRWGSLAPLTTTRTTSPSDPRRRSSSLQGKRRSSTSKGSKNESNDDPYLDSLLARSVHALELSNALLQSTISTKSSLASVLHSEDVLDRSLARQQRNISTTLREGQQMHAAWMGEMREVVEDVEDLFDDAARPHSMQDEYSPRAATATTGSLPSTSSSPLSSLSPRRLSTRALLPEHARTASSSSGGGLRRGERPRSPPPRALTQYVSVAHSKGTTAETTAPEDAIYLPSTTGLRAAAHVEEFDSPTSARGRTGLGFVDLIDANGWRMQAQDGKQ